MMTAQRLDLISRASPQTPGIDVPNSLTTPLSSLSTSMTPAERARERFRLGGNAIVTCGAGGLGFAVSRALLEHGVQGLMIFDTNPDKTEAQANVLRVEFPNARVRFLAVDVTDEAAVDTAVAQTVRLLGPVTTLLNFADTPDETTKSGRIRMSNVNTSGAFFVARAVARHMIVHKIGGSIIFVASLSAQQINSPQPQAPYNVSKAGVKAMVRSLAGEWARYGIRVNSISPGYMETTPNDDESLEKAGTAWPGCHPLGRIGRPDELCGVVVMLASRAGSYFNGSDREFLPL
jgi:sorbose reductase